MARRARGLFSGLFIDISGGSAVPVYKRCRAGLASLQRDCNRAAVSLRLRVRTAFGPEALANWARDGCGWLRDGWRCDRAWRMTYCLGTYVATQEGVSRENCARSKIRVPAAVASALWLAVGEPAFAQQQPEAETSRRRIILWFAWWPGRGNARHDDSGSGQERFRILRRRGLCDRLCLSRRDVVRP